MHRPHLHTNIALPQHRFVPLVNMQYYFPFHHNHVVTCDGSMGGGDVVRWEIGGADYEAGGRGRGRDCEVRLGGVVREGADGVNGCGA